MQVGFEDALKPHRNTIRTLAVWGRAFALVRDTHTALLEIKGSLSPGQPMDDHEISRIAYIFNKGFMEARENNLPLSRLSGHARDIDTETLVHHYVPLEIAMYVLQQLYPEVDVEILEGVSRAEMSSSRAEVTDKLREAFVFQKLKAIGDHECYRLFKWASGKIENAVRNNDRDAHHNNVATMNYKEIDRHFKWESGTAERILRRHKKRAWLQRLSTACNMYVQEDYNTLAGALNALLKPSDWPEGWPRSTQLEHNHDS